MAQLAAAYSHPLASPPTTTRTSSLFSSRPRSTAPRPSFSSNYTLQITTQLDAVVALSYEQLTRNPAYVRAILLSYCRYKMERKTGKDGRVRSREVGKKLDALERVLVKQGFTTFSSPLLQTRTTLSIPITDSSLPSSSSDVNAPAPFLLAYSIAPSSTSTVARPRSSTLTSSLHLYPNGEAPTLRVRRATVTGSSLPSSPAIFGNMDGIDRDRAPVVREEDEEGENEEGEGLPRYDAEGGGGGLPTYHSTTTAVVSGEAPRYVEADPVEDEEVEGIAARRRGREQFWWGVEGGAGGVA